MELPRDVLDELAAGTVSASAYVNVFMNTTQNFFVKVTDLQAAGGSQETETDSQDMQITAEVKEEVSTPSYTVTVPASVAMGSLSTEQENALSYTVKVEAADLNGTISVSAPQEGRPGQRRKQSVLCQQFWNTDGIRGYRGNRP